jgi:hypothetical protein
MKAKNTNPGLPKYKEEILFYLAAPDMRPWSSAFTD